MAVYLLAHDLGTTGDKATLFSEDGRLVGSLTAPYPLSVSGPCAEQNADDWWQAVITTTRALLTRVKPGEVAAVSFSGQMMGCLCVDREGVPLRPSIIWADIRATAQAEQAARILSGYEYYRRAGHRLSPSYAAAKFAWIRDNEPEVYQKTYKTLNAKDYIIYRLTGRFVTEYSDASSTCLLDVNTLTWSEELAEAHGIDRDKLPELLRSVDIAGKVTPEGARATGLAVGTPVVCGGGDGPAAAVGSGAVAPGRANLCLGTSSWISFAADAPLPDRDMTTFTFVHMVPGKWLPTGTMQTGGGSLSWAVRTLFCGEGAGDLPHRSQEEIYRTVNEEVEASRPGAGGLLFLPYLMGERSPRWNSDIRGCFLGLGLDTARGDMLRAVMEGVAANLDVVKRSFLHNGARLDSLLLSGGGARNPAWRRILCDLLGLPVKIPAVLEGATSMGAAVTAGVGIGLYDSFEAIDRFLTVREVLTPNEALSPVYEDVKARFDRAYEVLAPFFAR